MKLVIGNKNYSSWSLRPWMVLKQADIPFEEEQLSFNAPDFKARVARISPSAKVPALIDGNLVIWDSLAIVEYLAEKFPDRRLWPADAAARAIARSLCAEMHAGFQLLRSSMTMNFQVHRPGAGWNVAVQKEIDRIVAMWLDARARFGSGGSLLFGAFSIADAFFAPVVQRFSSYAVELPPVARAYADAVAALPSFQQWAEAARAENDFFPPDEPYRLAPDAAPRQGRA
jgi:glutathione S-transferase